MYTHVHIRTYWYTYIAYITYMLYSINYSSNILPFHYYYEYSYCILIPIIIRQIIQYTLLTYVLYSIFYIRYIYVSYQYHQITFVALHRSLHSRSSRSCHWILILLYCHLLTTLQTRPKKHGLTRDTCQTRPILSTYASYIYLQT